MSYWLIETEEQFNEIKEKSFKQVFLEIIPNHHNYHPNLSEISAIYIKPFINDKGYMLCFRHNDGFRLNTTLIDALSANIDEIYVINKKQKLYHLPYKNLYELLYLMPNEFEYPQNIVYKYFYNNFIELDDINNIIPITKHYEYCEELFDKIKTYFPVKYPEELQFLNNKASIAFLGIEKNGIKIDNKKFNKYFEISYPKFSLSYNNIFTNYNLNTITKRPSNAFNGLNFSAIPKDKSRESFIPKNDIFVEIDVSAYHPTLASFLINYEFEKSIYEDFVEKYNFTYEEAKNIIFKNLYGGIKKEYQHIEFFKLIKIFIDNLWENFNSIGYIECPVSKYKFYKDKLPDMNPPKLFNYFLQHYETINNIEILLEIHKILLNKKTQIVLYVYDSFLFDVDKTELFLIEKIKEIFKRKKLNIKISENINYNFVKP